MKTFHFIISLSVVLIVGVTSCNKDCSLDFSDIEVELPDDLDLEYYGLAVKNGEELWIADTTFFSYPEGHNYFSINLHVMHGEPNPNVSGWLKDESLSFQIPKDQLDVGIIYKLNNRNGTFREFVTFGYSYWDLDALSNRYLIPEGCDKSWLILDSLTDEEVEGRFQLVTVKEEAAQPTPHPDRINLTKGYFKAEKLK